MNVSNAICLHICDKSGEYHLSNTHTHANVHMERIGISECVPEKHWHFVHTSNSVRMRLLLHTNTHYEIFFLLLRKTRETRLLLSSNMNGYCCRRRFSGIEGKVKIEFVVAL